MASLDTLYNKPETRGDIKVKKVFTAPLSQLYIEPGNNVRYGAITVDSVTDLVESYLAGEPIPRIVVEVQPDGSLKVTAGHRRYTALCHIVNTLGNEKFNRVEVQGINGDRVSLIKYQVNENKGLNLGPVDIALACQQLSECGLSPAQIASELSYSESKVNYHLTIAKMSDDVKQAIVDGKIAADFAADIFRKKGDGGVLAVLNGVTEKVTRKSAGLWRPSMGKSVVSMFTDVMSDADETGVTVKLTHDQWKELQKAVKALGGE